MSKPATPRDGITVVLPVHNAAPQIEKMLPGWGVLLNNLNRPFQLIVVNDGSTDHIATVLEKLQPRISNLRVLTHEKPMGFGACLRTALAETTQPLFLYAGIDSQYTPTDIRPMLERIELRDEIFGKQPDLINGSRAGQPRPLFVIGTSAIWKFFWRVFAGLPMVESLPWYGWGAWWFRARAKWVYGVPLADINSLFKLYRTAFLKRVPIQSDGDFVHTELVAKATFLTSIMDEIPLTPRTEDHPPIGATAADRHKVFNDPEFVVREQPKPPETPKENTAGELSSPVSPAPAT